MSDILDEQDFYEACQQYRHARDAVALAPGLPNAAEAFEQLKDWIRANYRPDTLQVRDTMPADGGWIEWKGGECPVPYGTKVSIRFANGDIERCSDAWGWLWTHTQEGGDIVAYKVLP